MQEEMSAQYCTTSEWVHVSKRFMAYFKKDRDYKICFDIWEFQNHPLPTYLNPDWSVNVQMFEFRTIFNLFLSKLTPQLFRGTHHEPFTARKFIISLHPIQVILEKYLAGVDLDEVRRIGSNLYVHGGEDVKTSVIMYVKADEAFKYNRFNCATFTNLVRVPDQHLE